MEEIQVGSGRAGEGRRGFFLLFHLFQDTKLKLWLLEGLVLLRRTRRLQTGCL